METHAIITFIASGGLFILLFGFFSQKYFARIEDQIKNLEIKIDKTFNELSGFKIDVAKSGLETLKNDLAESKERLLRLENSEERHWATLERLSANLEAIRK
jgi:hypothetical protein